MRTLQSRFLEFADLFHVYVCMSCGYLVDDANRTIDYCYCRRCRASNTVRIVRIPFTLLVLANELTSTGVSVRLEVKDSV